MPNQEQDYEAITLILREEVKALFEKEEIKYVIGWTPGSYGLRISPAFVYDTKDVDSLIWSPFCINSLAVYPTLEEKLPLPRGTEEDTRKIGIFVKGCDSRGLVQMFVEKGYPRERVVVLGVPCTGQIEPDKLIPILTQNGIDKEINLTEIEILDLGEKYKLRINEKELEISELEVIYDKCLNCKYPNPIIYDNLITGQVEPRAKLDEGYEKVAELEAVTDAERWTYWAEKFDRCIRCYACKNICPVCYFKECLADKWDPDWIRKSKNLTENTMFHITRAFHLAGRCVSCYECERACPVGIPLLDLYKKLDKEIIARFNYEPGTDPEAKSLLTTFNPDDPGEFIL